MKAKVRNMTGSSGKEVANQFIIEAGEFTYFQSYSTIIARRRGGQLILDRDSWNYSKTTSRYRNQFTGLDTKETIDMIERGEIKLAKLNKK